MKKYQEMMNVSHLPLMPVCISQLKELSEEDEFRCDYAVAFGGSSVLGKGKHVCQVVTLFSGDMESIWGWTLCIGLPKQKEELYFWKTIDRRRDTSRNIEIPNGEICFSAKIDESIVREDIDRDILEKVFAYILPYLRSEGPPPPHPQETRKKLIFYH